MVALKRWDTPNNSQEETAMPAVSITSSEQYEKAIEVLTRLGGVWQGVGQEEQFLIVSERQCKALIEANVTTPEQVVTRITSGKRTRKTAKS
jgi:hypothetical protein